MFFGEVYKLVNIRLYCFHATLHGRYRITLPLKTHALPPDSSKLVDGSLGRSTSMMSMKVAPKNEDLIGF